MAFEREYACILAPALTLQALVRSEPDLAGLPVATQEGEGSHARLVHLSRAARAAGLVPGMTPSQARSVAPEAVLRSVPDRVVAAARQALVDVAWGFSPRVEPRDGDAVVLDARGSRAMFPVPSGLGAALEAACARIGLRVRVGIAAGPRLARIVARALPGVTVIPPGAEAATVAPLPLAALDPSPDLATTLARLGLRTIGDLARIGGRGLGIRLGPEAMDLHDLARGADASGLRPFPPAEVFEEAVDLDYLLERLEPLTFLLGAAVERLAARLEARQAAPAALRLSLSLDPQGVHTVTITPPAPTDDVRSLVSLLRLSLESDPPPAPVRGFALDAQAGRIVPSQGHLFGPPVPEPGRLSTLLGRLASLAGPANVGAPTERDTRERDASGLGRFDPPALGEERPVASVPAGVLALRRFRPPAELEVRLRDGRPARVRGPGVAGPITRAAGPWYADAGWWTERPQAGAFWDVEVDEVGRFRLWHDLATDRWYADGEYD